MASTDEEEYDEGDLPEEGEEGPDTLLQNPFVILLLLMGGALLLIILIAWLGSR